jgi:hypothetical protein
VDARRVLHLHAPAAGTVEFSLDNDNRVTARPIDQLVGLDVDLLAGIQYTEPPSPPWGVHIDNVVMDATP